MCVMVMQLCIMVCVVCVTVMHVWVAVSVRNGIVSALNCIKFMLYNINGLPAMPMSYVCALVHIYGGNGRIYSQGKT